MGHKMIANLLLVLLGSIVAMKVNITRTHKLTPSSILATHKIVSFALKQGFSDISGLTEYLGNRALLEYYGTIHIGSQGEPLNVIFDTGSDLLWVPVTGCTKCHTAPVFHNERSTTFRTLNVPLSIQYQLGETSGYLCEDRISLSGAQVDSVRFMCATKDSDLEGTLASGVLGLNIDSYYSSVAPSIIRYFLTQGYIREPIMGVYLSQEADDTSSHIDFGSLDPQVLKNKTVNWVNAVAKSEWALKLSAAFLGEEKLNLQAVFAIIDTGSSYLTIPANDFTQIATYYRKQFDCSFLDTSTFYCIIPAKVFPKLPALNISLDDRQFSLYPEDYLQLMDYTMSREYAYALFKIVIMPSRNFWILGDNFMQKYYTIFDFANKRIGFVELNSPVLQYDVKTSYAMLLVYGLAICVCLFAIIYGVYRCVERFG